METKTVNVNPAKTKELMSRINWQPLWSVLKREFGLQEVPVISYNPNTKQIELVWTEDARKYLGILSKTLKAAAIRTFTSSISQEVTYDEALLQEHIQKEHWDVSYEDLGAAFEPPIFWLSVGIWYMSADGGTNWLDLFQASYSFDTYRWQVVIGGH